MSSQKKLKLIEGVFSTQEGREILMNVFSSKIQFHRMKSFSAQERFGIEDAVATKRVPELKKSVEELIKIIEEAESKGMQLEITSEVIINYCK